MKPGAEDNPLENGVEDDVDNEQEVSSGETTVSVQSSGSDGVPYAARRSGVKDDREMEPVWVQGSTSEKQREVKAEVESIVGYDVYLTDFKEAAYLEGLSNPVAVAELLDEWGCEYA